MSDIEVEANVEGGEEKKLSKKELNKLAKAQKKAELKAQVCDFHISTIIVQICLLFRKVVKQD